LPAEMSAVRPQPKSFTATFNPTLVRTMSQMQANLATGVEQVIDARGPGKFDGTQEDVFPFKKLGHIPNAVNIPWGDLIHPDTGTTCASGITSCVVTLGLYLLGHKTAAVYDGSWAEWGLAEDTPAAAAVAA